MDWKRIVALFQGDRLIDAIESLMWKIITFIHYWTFCPPDAKRSR
jgi:hypothetical protein